MRKNDSGTVRHFHTDRFFLVSGGWYFATREGENFGPFNHRDEAATRLHDYLETQSIMSRLRTIDPALNDDDPENAKRIARLASDLHKDRQRND
jgi:hypothetical protein